MIGFEIENKNEARQYKCTKGAGEEEQDKENKGAGLVRGVGEQRTRKRLLWGVIKALDPVRH